MPIPHIPHNIPEGKVGKPEGLSGSQTENSSLKNNRKLLLEVAPTLDTGLSSPFPNAGDNNRADTSRRLGKSS